VIGWAQDALANEEPDAIPNEFLGIEEAIEIVHRYGYATIEKEERRR
jgi:hypothetical protein